MQGVKELTVYSCCWTITYGDSSFRTVIGVVRGARWVSSRSGLVGTRLRVRLSFGPLLRNLRTTLLSSNFSAYLASLHGPVDRT